MDPDEELARALQIVIPAEPQVQCEDELLQALALSLMPLEKLQSDAAEQALLSRSLGESEGPAEEDLLAQGLLKWFKTEFFSWMDKPSCCRCTCNDTSAIGMGEPNVEERQLAAGRVELYKCTVCEQVTRFPRYNDVGKLLETRCGRCGEWANAFLLFCRTAGLDARYILDMTDHVWTEYYSHHLKRWVHMDSCEASWDQPLLYEGGWGKKLSYVIAIGRDGLLDVTRRYTRKFEELLPRRTMVSEQWLITTLAAFTQQLRKELPAEARLALELREALERQELDHIHEAAQPTEALPGRQTGSLEWRSERGETGDTAPAPTARPPTSYKKTPALPPVFAAFGPLQGGACRASGENGPESADNAFDGRATTKWLDFGGGGVHGSAWLEYRFLAGSPTVAVTHYDLVSANDSPERDPASWVLEGLVEGASTSGPSTEEAWQELDSRTGVLFSGRHQPLTFTVPSPRACERLRLRITRSRDPGSSTCMQLACLQLYALPAASDVAAAAAEVQRAEAAGELGSGPGGVLRKLLANLRDNPKDAKFRKVRVSKVAELVSNHGAVALLAHAGFHPIMLDDAAQQGGREPFLVAAEALDAAAQQAAITAACAALGPAAALAPPVTQAPALTSAPPVTQGPPVAPSLPVALAAPVTLASPSVPAPPVSLGPPVGVAVLQDAITSSGISAMERLTAEVGAALQHVAVAADAAPEPLARPGPAQGS